MSIKSKFSWMLFFLLFSFTTWFQCESRAGAAMNQDDGENNGSSLVAQQEQSDDATAKDAIEIKLPDDPQAVVLKYHIEGGGRRSTEEDFQPSTLLQVLANGTVLVGRNDPRATELEYSITKEEVRELLDDVINKNRILDITTDGIKQSMEDTGRKFFLLNAPAHRISIELPNQKHEVEVDALVSTRKFYSDIEQIQTFAKLHDKFKVMRARAAIGTQDKIDKLMQAIDKKFKEQYSEGEPLTIEDVESAIIDEKGRLLAEFKRVDDDGTRAFAYACTVRRSKKGKTSITLMRVGLPSSKKREAEKNASETDDNSDK